MSGVLQRQTSVPFGFTSDPDWEETLGTEVEKEGKTACPEKFLLDLDNNPARGFGPRDLTGWLSQVSNFYFNLAKDPANSENIEILGTCIENIHGLEYNKEKGEFEINKNLCPVPKITRKNNQEDITTYQTDDLCSDDEVDESPNSSTSMNSSQSMKKRWNKFLSEISRK